MWICHGDSGSQNSQGASQNSSRYMFPSNNRAMTGSRTGCSPRPSSPMAQLRRSNLLRLLLGIYSHLLCTKKSSAAHHEVHKPPFTPGSIDRDQTCLNPARQLILNALADVSFVDEDDSRVVLSVSNRPTYTLVDCPHACIFVELPPSGFGQGLPLRQGHGGFIVRIVCNIFNVLQFRLPLRSLRVGERETYYNYSAAETANKSVLSINA